MLLRFAVFAAFATSSLTIQLAAASEVSLISELKFSSIASPLSSNSAIVVRGVTYSPDGKWIAVVAGTSRSICNGNDLLMLIPVQSQTAPTRPVALGACATRGPLEWSLDSKRIIVKLLGGHFIHLRVVAGILLEPKTHSGVFAGFLDSDNVMVTQQSGIPGVSPAGEITICNLETDAHSTPKFGNPGFDYVAAFGPPARALVYSSTKHSAMVIDPITNAELMGGLTLSANPEVRFCDGGKTVCIGSFPFAMRPMKLRCFDIERKVELRRHPRVQNGAPFEIAQGAAVLLASDMSRPAVPFLIGFLMEDGNPLVAHAWVLWDMRSGKEIARMPYQLQDRQAKKKSHLPAQAALSPDGRRIAVGCGDFLRVYEVL